MMMANAGPDVYKRQKHLCIRRHEALLVVGQVVAFAECLHQRLGPAKVTSGHGREQVMLDLIIQTPEGEVADDPPPHIASGDDLAFEKPGGVTFGQDGHALVIRRKCARCV